MTRKLSIVKISLLFVLFLAIWGFCIFCVLPLTEGSLSRWGEAAFEGGVKAAVWLGFGLISLRRYAGALPVKAKEMFTAKPDVPLLLKMGGIMLVGQLAGMFFRHRGFYVSPEFHPSDLITMFFVVGICEELVFRGFFMNALSAHMSEESANMVSALFFMAVHFPKYIYDGTFFSLQIFFACAFLFSIGVIFGYAFRKTHCIWVPAILHSVWDLLAVTIGGV